MWGQGKSPPALFGMTEDGEAASPRTRQNPAPSLRPHCGSSGSSHAHVGEGCPTMLRQAAEFPLKRRGLPISPQGLSGSRNQPQGRLGTCLSQHRRP